MKKFLFLKLLFISVFFNCNSVEKPISINENFKKDLYENLNKENKVSFSYKILSDFLDNVNIQKLKAGKMYEKEVLFEESNSECKDRMKIYYSKKNKEYVLFIHEETFEKDLEWCSEGAYNYSFQIKNNQIINVKYEFIAG